MELNGLQIFKYLPAAKKTEGANCKQCGFQTCMAFALKLAQKQADITLCSYVPQELKDAFADFSKVQQNVVKYGCANPVQIGGETVMFRHEKTFVNKTSVAVKLDSDDADFDAKLKKISSYSVERVGEIFKVDAIYLVDKGKLNEAAKKVDRAGLGLIIKTADASCEADLAKYNPVFELENGVYPANKSLNAVVCAKNIDELAKNCENYLNAGLNNIVINLDNEEKSLAKIIEEQTQIRRLSILNRDKFFAYPVMTKLFEKEDLPSKLARASFLMCRYSNLLVLDVFDEAMLTTLFTLRQNIYTDPQKPLQVESKVYEVNSADENSLVLLTTNFALTYFAVVNELESTGTGAYLVVTPSDGMSVLTAWSADKFTAEIVSKTIGNSKLLQGIKNKHLIIPGLLSHMEEELQEILPDWKILLGPKDACDLPDYMAGLRKS